MIEILKLHPQFRIKTIDRHTTPFVDQLKGVDVVIHLAALAHQKGNDFQDYYLSNTLLTQKLAHASIQCRVKHFLFVSTIKVYGEGQHAPYSKNDPPNPQDDYAKSKYLAEKYIVALGNGQHKFQYTILRIPLIYGPKAKGNLKTLNQIVNKMPIIPLGNIHNKRSLLYIYNFTSLVLHLLNIYKDSSHFQKIYVPTDRNPHSTTELVQKIIRTYNYKRLLLPMPYFLQKIFKHKSKKFQKLCDNLYINDSDIFQELGFTPPYTLDNADI